MGSPSQLKRTRDSSSTPSKEDRRKQSRKVKNGKSAEEEYATDVPERLGAYVGYRNYFPDPRAKPVPQSGRR